MKQFSFALCAMALSSLLACNTEVKVKSANDNFDLGAAREKIDAHNKQITEYYRTGDTASMANHFADNAVIYPPEMPAIKKQDVPATFGAFKRMGVADINLTSTSLSGDSETLVELGTWEIYAEDKTKIDHGKFLVIWENQNGTWKTTHDMWNNSTPIPRSH